MTDPAASVIVPTYRDWAVLGDCLAALGAQDLPADAFEILVVNNDPGDPAPEGLDWPPNARLLAEPAKGSYAARNRALAEARGAGLLFTDADCRPEPDWVRRALDALGRAEVIGGRIEMTYARGIEDVGDVYARLFPFRQDRNVAHGWAATANMAARRAVFDAIGPFDPAHVSGGDAEWGRRASAAGHAVVYAPEVVVRHPARDAPEEILTTARRIQTGALTRARREKGPARARREFLLRALKQTLVPPTKPIRPLVRLDGAGPWLKLRTYAFAWGLRFRANAEGVRILFRGGEGERR